LSFYKNCFQKKDQIAQVILNQLYKYTQMQTTFGVIMLAWADKTNLFIFFIKILVRLQLFEIDQGGIFVYQSNN